MKAKKLGYFLELHYVGVDSAQIAKDRVRRRIENAGYAIPEKDIEELWFFI